MTIAKKWKIKGSVPAKIDKELADYSKFQRVLLYNRGIKKADEAEKYLNPSYERDLFDPSLMLGMEKATERIIQAIKNNEKIIIYADYDADGVPGGVVLYTFFQEIGYKNIEVYIPNRNLEAYGLNLAAIKEFSNDTKLIVTVDCGVTDVEEVTQAKKLGIDVVVTDHHPLKEKAPKAYAVVDSKQEKDKYPFKTLCGCAVAFKLVQSLMRHYDDHQFREGWEKWLLDLVAISTVADMVPMNGENRILTHFGLKVLRQTKRLGLIELFKKAKVSKENIVEDDISFMIGPRLNAASRMSHASQSFYLLTSENLAEVKDVAAHLEEKNIERKESVDRVFSQTSAWLEAQEKIPEVIVYGAEDFLVGGLGLAANRIKDKYGKTTFLWGGVGEEAKGSARSNGEINVVELMTEAGGEKTFSNFGGHAMAAGFGLPLGDTGKLEKAILAAYPKVKKIEIEESVVVDAEISLDDVAWGNYFAVEKMSPYGIDNPKPIFALRNVEIAGAKAFGNGGIHLELSFIKPDGKKVSAIGFFACSAAEKFDAVNGHIYRGAVLEPGQKIDLLVNLEKSTFKSYPELRLRIVDIHATK